ncbi:hypothetical protein ACFP3Q_00565 [Nocardioides sp. GCM10027113]|uniref:hypothetical protein n=1 Tax=unclassified Nocardioides TaxID=2615069 RepID=UPI0036105048
MSHLLSRVMSAATASYAVFALAKPEHLANAMEADPDEREFYDSLARGYGVRDLAIGALGIAGPASAVPAAMGLRIASDLADAAILAVRAPDRTIRAKVLGVTLGWAALNAAALAADRRRAA